MPFWSQPTQSTIINYLVFEIISSPIQARDLWQLRIAPTIPKFSLFTFSKKISELNLRLFLSSDYNVHVVINRRWPLGLQYIRTKCSSKFDRLASKVDLRWATGNFRWAYDFRICICNVGPIFQILCDQLLVEKKIFWNCGLWTVDRKRWVDLMKKEERGRGWGHGK